MSDFNRGFTPQGFTPQGFNRGEGGGMEQQLQNNYQNQQVPQGQYPTMTPEQQFIGNLASDPAMAAQLAREMQQRLMGQQQQQQPATPVNPFEAIEKDIATLQNEVNTLAAVPAEQRDWGTLTDTDRRLQARRVDLMEARQRYSYEQQQQRDKYNEARNIASQFHISVIGSMPDDYVQNQLGTTKQQLSAEFNQYVSSRYSRDELSNPQFLQRILGDLWKAFAFERSIPAPGQFGNVQNQNQQYQGMRQGEQQGQYNPNQPQQQYNPQQYGQPQQGQDSNQQADPLANIFTGGPDGLGMTDPERAMMKAYHYDNGNYDIANRIVYRDGSPIPKRGDM